MTETAMQSATQRDIVVVQRNPTSGTGRRRRQLVDFIRALRAQGLKVRSFKDRDACDKWVRSHPEPERIRCIVAAGGDGTLVNVAQRHPGMTLAVFPMGTENLFARYLEIPPNGTLAAKVVATGTETSFDVGTVNGQTFLIMVSTGVDADVVRRLSEVRRGNISHLSYLGPILRSFVEFNPPRLTALDEDGTVIGEGSHVIVANLPEYGFRMPFAPEARPDDGLLDVVIFKEHSTWQTICYAVKMRLGFSVEDSVIRSQHSSVRITSDASETAVQFDGDPGGVCPVEISIQPAAIKCLVPAESSSCNGAPN